MRKVDKLVKATGVAKASRQCRVAGILFTYGCTIRCRHCLFGCAGDLPDVAMTPAQCAEGLALLHETGRVVHIAGGEPMLYWESLAEAVALAHQDGNAPHFMETNCSFAADDGVVRERLEFLSRHGLRGIYASTDAFHQEHVPPENFLRVRRIVKELFGPENFYGSDLPDDDIRASAAIARDDARLREHVRAHPPTMVGAAHRELAQYLDAFAPEDDGLPVTGWQGPRNEKHCLSQFRADTLWELHVDPYGNIQTNCGMVLGTLPDDTPARILAEGPEHANRFVRMVCKDGPWALVEFAHCEHGYEPPARVTQSCELCYLARRFLRRYYPDVFAPGEVYA